MPRLYIVRHGQTDWNVQKIVMGQKDVPLNETGRDQAQKLMEALEPLSVDAIYSSPQLRAMETIEPFAKKRGLPVMKEGALAEVDYQHWVGLTLKNLSEDTDFQQYRAEPVAERYGNVEGILAVLRRTSGFMESLAEKYPDQGVVLVSHGDPIRTLLSHALALPIESFRRIRVANASLSVVLRHHEKWILTLLNHRLDPDFLAEL